MARMRRPPTNSPPRFIAPEAAARQVALLDWAESQDLGALWSAEDARWATQQARTEGAADLRLARARHAARRLGERDDRLASLLQRRGWRPAWVAAAGLVGLVLGLAVDRLGGQQLNLLALPLWPLLGLQLVAYAVLLALACRGRMPDVPLSALWRRLLLPAGRGRATQAQAHWWRLSRPLQAARAALLWHAGLLGLNLGLIAGLYLRALGLEILVGWESTYLDAAQVQRLADVLLAPAALLTGIAVPDVAPLRHGALQGPQALAADWLHLLAATVALVTLPRLLLVAGAALRSGRLARALPLAVGSGPMDLRLHVVDPQQRLAASLLGTAGEVLASPEGDRLLLTRADAPPTTLPVPWTARLGLLPTPAPAFDLQVDAADLPAGSPGWPAQRRQLLALGALWPAPLQPAWQRLFADWDAHVQQREARAQRAMAEALARLGLQPLHLPDGADAQARLQTAVAQQLDLLAAQLQDLYGEAPAGEAAPAAAAAWAHHVVRPRSVARSSVLGGALGGAATGLGADLATGGLTLGAGALAGAVAGGVAASGLTDWLNRRQGRRSPALQIDIAQAAPLLAAEVLGLWMAQLGLKLPAAQVDALLAAQPWHETLAGDPAMAAARLQPLLAAACERLLHEDAR
jgi:hypothetical protein